MTQASLGANRAVAVTATVLTPFSYHTHATPPGTATGARFLADRAMSYALAKAMGALAATPACFSKDYRRDLSRMPWLCSVFDAEAPRLLPPMGKRLNLNHEGGHSKYIQEAPSTGNLKDWFYVQEVPAGVVFHGAIFGPDPFEMAARAENRPVSEIVVRTGRHLNGLLALRRSPDTDRLVRLNAHTARLLGVHPSTDEALRTDVLVLQDIQVTRPAPFAAAAGLIGRTRRDLAA